MSSTVPIKVLITGASRGIGRACALEFAAHGFHVIAVARDRERLSSLQSEIKIRGRGPCTVLVADLARAAQVEELRAEVERAGLNPDILINNAGAGHWRFLTENSVDEIQATLDTPFLSTVLVTRAFLPAMLARNSGKIVNITTPAAYFPWAGATMYAAARWAVRGFTQALRADLAGSGVTVSLVTAGEVASDYFANHPGSHDRLPWISKMPPVLSPAQTGAVHLPRGRAPTRR